MDIERELRQFPEFEPGSLCKQAWLKARKKPISYGGRKFPGFFCVNESKHKFDSVMLLVIFALELYGFVMIYFSFVGTLIILKFLFVLLLIIADIMLARTAFKKDDELCLAKNRKDIIDIEKSIDDSPANRGRLTVELNIIKEIKSHQNKFLIWLFVIAILKIGILLWDIKGGGPLTGEWGWFISKYWPYMTAAVVFYLTIPYLVWEFYGHWYQTNEFYTVFKNNRDDHLRSQREFELASAKFKEKGGPEPKEKDIIHFYPAQARFNPVISLTESLLQKFNISKLSPIGITDICQHSLSEGRTSSDYILTTKGILTDAGLHTLAQGQETASQGEFVGFEGLKRQISIYEA